MSLFRNHPYEIYCSRKLEGSDSTEAVKHMNELLDGRATKVGLSGSLVERTGTYFEPASDNEMFYIIRRYEK